MPSHKATAKLITEIMMDLDAGPDSSLHAMSCEPASGSGACSCLQGIADAILESLSEAGLLVKTPIVDSDWAALTEPWREESERAQDAYVLAIEMNDRGETPFAPRIRAMQRLSRFAAVRNAMDELLADLARWASKDAQLPGPVPR